MSTPSQQFTGYWAVILGGSSGFGFAAAEKLAMHGMNIAVLYRETAHTEKLLLLRFEALAKENNVRILPFNINALDENGRAKFIESFSKQAGKNCVRLLLHSIARGNLKPLMAEKPENSLTTDDIRHTTYAMSNSIIDWARLLLQENLFNNDARIIGLTSAGADKYWSGYAAVSIAKASLKSLATYMAVEFAKYNIKTNLIQAGITETPALKMIPGNSSLIEFATTNNPLGRMTTPQDVANAIYLLCTDEAAWINGALLHVDGGEHCH
ncbi:MAG: SDR family oxidoreductase [Bacteroidetes bacterium]|nr:SDR family oxidoreductase [Bacteroidota bacterium]